MNRTSYEKTDCLRSRFFHVRCPALHPPYSFFTSFEGVVKLWVVKLWRDAPRLSFFSLTLYADSSKLLQAKKIISYWSSKGSL